MPSPVSVQASHPSSFIKMEDRKRSAGDDLAPPTKRQAVNGKSIDSDMPWKDDLEVRCHLVETSTLILSSSYHPQNVPHLIYKIPETLMNLCVSTRPRWLVSLCSFYQEHAESKQFYHVGGSPQAPKLMPTSSSHYNTYLIGDDMLTLELTTEIPERCHLSPDARIQAREGPFRISAQGCSKAIYRP